MAETAVGFVMDHLLPSLEAEVKLLKGLGREVEGIKAELQIIEPYLRDADERVERGEANDGVAAWVKQVRQVSYRIEDAIDQYIYSLQSHSHPHPSRPRRFFPRSLDKFARSILKLKPRHQIASEIEDIKTKIQQLQDLRIRYGLQSTEEGSSTAMKNFRRNDPRVASLFIEEAELVGIEVPRAELNSWMAEKVSPKRTVITVVGGGGLGKTTLVKKVYEDQIATGSFVCHAFVPVSESYKIEEVLRILIKKLHESTEGQAVAGIDQTMDMVSLIDKLRDHLMDKMYVVVFDDVWDTGFWEVLTLALPNNNRGSRVLITTRNNNVAVSCKESPFDHVHNLQPLPEGEAWNLFCKKAFHSDSGGGCPDELKELSEKIIRKCEGVPLAIVAIGGLLSTKDKVLSQFQKFHVRLGFELQNNPQLQGMRRILSLSYLVLPYFFKSCFLYFGIFPEDYSISCVRLVRLWMAEGFVKEERGKTLEETAEEYLTELIHRSLVLVSRVDFDGKARSCRVHDVLREIILSKFEELNFCQLLTEEDSRFDGQTRRLSVHKAGNIMHDRQCSRIRSVFIFQNHDLPESFTATLLADLKLLKVLDFEDAPINNLPEEMGSLLHLRYLSVRNTSVKTLPKSIGRLRSLMTLDLKNSLVTELPVEIKTLSKLRHLLAYHFRMDSDLPLDDFQGVKTEEGLGCLEALQKLYFVEVNHGNGLINELKKLRQLRKLGITKLKATDGKALCSAVEEMSGLESLDVWAASGDETISLKYMSSPPQSLQRFYLKGRLEKFPSWISKLQNLIRVRLRWSRLTEDPLTFLEALPSLLELGLYGAYDGEALCFEERAFQKLQVLALQDLNALSSVIINRGSLPRLQVLRIGPCPRLKQVPPGIQHLKCLTSLRFYDMSDEYVDGMLPDGGRFYRVVEHVPIVLFHYMSEGGFYTTHSLR